MKNRTNLFTGLLLILFCVSSLTLNAADTIVFEKTLPSNAIPGQLNYIVLHLYEAEDDMYPVASQTLYPGDWQITEGNTSSKLQVPDLDVGYLEGYEQLWAETEVNGAVVGTRAVVKIVAPGMSVGGVIESRSGGFKFPDTTVQTTAGISGGDLSAHTANASAHHSPNVTTGNIVDGTILPADINLGGNFTFGGVVVQGSGFEDRSQGDFEIYDNFNGFRWYDAAEVQLANILVNNSGYVSFNDSMNSRTIFDSDANGIGIGTSSPSATHAVTMPSLNVTGDLEIGLERVSLTYNLASTGTCHSHGNLTCYYGSGTVQCPVGTRVLGGGVNGNAFYGGTGDSYPISTTSWRCESSYDLSNSTDVCYALCARLE